MNDHSHPHGDHSHGHDHDHSHDHDHGHAPTHAHGSGPATSGPETPIDPGSQALSEALRSSFVIVKVAMALLVVAFFASGFFEVGPQEQAVILRFGKPVGEGEAALRGPGLHWSYPYPIDEVVKIPITGYQQVRSTVGWYATTPAQEAAGTEPPPGPSLNPAVDGYVVTADGNIVHSRATLFFRINNPNRFIFAFTNAQATVQSALNNALVQTAARFKVDDILSADVTGFQDAVRFRVTQSLEANQLGVVVDRCEVQSIPPRTLRAVFDGVASAGNARRSVLDDAQKYRNQVLSQATANAQSLTNRAESERGLYVSSLNSLASSFDELLPQYNRNPQLFVQRRYSEALSRSLTNAEKWVLSDPSDGKSPELRLLLNREPPRPRTSQNPQ